MKSIKISVIFALVIFNCAFFVYANQHIQPYDKGYYYINKDNFINLKGYTITQNIKENKRLAEQCENAIIPPVGDFCEFHDKKTNLTFFIEKESKVIYGITQDLKYLSSYDTTIFGIKKNDTIEDVLKKTSSFIKQNRLIFEYYNDRSLSSSQFVLTLRFDQIQDKSNAEDPDIPHHKLRIAFNKNMVVDSIHIDWAISIL